MAIELNGTTGITTPGLTNTGTETIVNLTTTGNTILGNASTDTLNVGNGGLVKDASGNVGIGTSSPVAKLDVRGIFAISNSAASYWALDRNDSDGSLTFTDTSTERMRIDSSGNLLVGTTSGTERVTAAGTNANWMYSSNSTGSGTFYHFIFKSNGTQTGTITSTSTTATYGTSSDYRLKENIVPMTGALDKVALLKPVTYTWKLDGSAGQGFIAHELQEVVPDAVQGEKDAVNEDGSIKSQGIDTSFLVATLTAAIQEQQAMIDELKAKVAALEAA